MKLTEEQIEKIIAEACARWTHKATLGDIARAAIELACGTEVAQPAPAKKPWPKLPVCIDDSPDGWMALQEDGSELCFGREKTEAAIFAFNALPRLVAMLRFEKRLNPGPESATPDSYYGDRDALLAGIDASGFDLPEVKP